MSFQTFIDFFGKPSRSAEFIPDDLPPVTVDIHNFPALLGKSIRVYCKTGKQLYSFQGYFSRYKEAHSLWYLELEHYLTPAGRDAYRLKANPKPGWEIVNGDKLHPTIKMQRYILSLQKGSHGHPIDLDR